MADPNAASSDPFYLTGPGIESRPEVTMVKHELLKIHIFLEGFGIEVVGVYPKPRPYGFDFQCRQPRALLARARQLSDPKVGVFNEDSSDTLEGRFSAYVTHGVGFRQIGTGPRLHLEVSVMDGKCNVHIDSHGYVVGPGDYDPNRALLHGYWDLLSDKLPGLYGSFGDHGQIGPLVAPMRGVDGKWRWFIGINGEW